MGVAGYSRGRVGGAGLYLFPPSTDTSRIGLKPCCSDLGSPLNSLPQWTPIVVQNPQGLRLLMPCYLAVPPALRCYTIPPYPYPVVSTSIGGVEPASWVVPSCPQTSYIQRPLVTGVSVLSSPSLLCFLLIRMTPPMADPDAKPTSSGLPGGEGKGYLVLQPSCHSGRSAAG